MYAWGFRVFDPTEQTRFEAILHALSDADVPDKPRSFPVNVAGDKIGSYRQRVERTMERWIRILDLPAGPQYTRAASETRDADDFEPADSSEVSKNALQPLMDAGQIAVIVRHVTAGPCAIKTLTECGVLGEPEVPTKGGRGKKNLWKYETVCPHLKGKYRSEFPDLSALGRYFQI